MSERKPSELADYINLLSGALENLLAIMPDFQPHRMTDTIEAALNETGLDHAINSDEGLTVCTVRVRPEIHLNIVIDLETPDPDGLDPEILNRIVEESFSEVKVRDYIEKLQHSVDDDGFTVLPKSRDDGAGLAGS